MAQLAGAGAGAGSEGAVDPAAAEVLSFLHSQTDLTLQMVTFEPLDLDSVHIRLASAGSGMGKMHLLSVLDSLAIFVSVGLDARRSKKDKERRGKEKRRQPKGQGRGKRSPSRTPA